MRDPKVSILAADAQAAAVAALLSSGWMRFFSESGELLSQLRFQADAFMPPENGAVISMPLAPDMEARGGGVATRFEAQTESGEMVFGGSVGVLGDEPGQYDYEFVNSAMIHPGSEVHVASIAYRAWIGS